jgi:3-methyladenine DNA glycosylase/8-oxoguanine DNA glycosylase
VDLDIDAGRALSHLRASDAELGRLIDGVGPFALALPDDSSTFAALAEAIVYQQLAPRAAATIFQRFCALFPGAPACPAPAQVLEASDEALRSAGLSGAKRRALSDLAQRSVGGEVPTLEEARGMDDEAIVERLVRVRGVGRWTAEMFLIFTLGRPDVLPADDYGLRRGFQVAFGGESMPGREEVLRRGVRWAPYRTVASWYLWRARETAG